ncbi:MAG: undecaprenyl-phosphate glucose phosphotransferase, partial [Gammaproteobacteria bacterium]
MRRYHVWLVVVQRFVDALVVWAGLPTLCWLNDQVFNQPYQLAAILGGILTWVAMGAVDAYRPWRGANYWQESRVLTGGWLLAVAMLLAIAWLTKTTEIYSRLIVGTWFIVAPLALIALHALERKAMRFLRRHGRNTRTAIILGAGSLGQEVAQRIQESEWMGIRLLAFFDDDKRRVGKEIAGVPVVDSCEHVKEYVQEHDVDKVFLALPMRSESRSREVFDDLQDTTASVYWVPDIFIFEMLQAREQDIGGLPVFA